MKSLFFHGSYLWDRIFNCIYTKAFQSSVRLVTWICSMVCKSCQNFCYLCVHHSKAHKAHCFMSYIYLDFCWDKKTIKWSIINVIFHDGYEYSQVCKHASFEMSFCHSRHFADRSVRNFRWCLLQISLANCFWVRQARLSYMCTEQGDKSHCRLPAFKARDACLLHVSTACTPESSAEMINRKTDMEGNVSQGVPPTWGKGNLQMFRLQHPKCMQAANLLQRNKQWETARGWS